ncbi:SpoIIE family protein phosphatase [Streptomyces sp. NPDC088348]
MLFRGDPLLLYTDGLTEARVGPQRDLYGEDALHAFTNRTSPGRPPRL